MKQRTKRLPVIRSNGLLRWGLLLAALLLFAAPLFARDWSVAGFDCRYTVGNDGSVLIEEAIHPSFHGTYNGIERYIPIEYPGPDGTYTLSLKVESVTDENGHSLRFEQSRESDGSKHQLKLRIYAGGTDTVRTVHITYRASNAVRYFPDHDEFYWNATGNDWKVPIEQASAYVSLPSAAAGKVKVQAFTGAFGSTAQDATTRIDGSYVTFYSNRPLPPGSGLTVDVWIPKGVLAQPSWFTPILRAGSLQLPPIFTTALLPLWALIVMFCLWAWTNRDRGPAVSVQTLYEPPAGLTPAEAATLVDKQLMSRDITATMIDLARRGYLRIRETNETLLGCNVKDYALSLLKSRSTWEPTLAQHELEVLDTLFPLDAMLESVATTETTLSFASGSFPAALPKIRAEIYRAMRKKGILLTLGLPTMVGCLVVIVAPFLWLQGQGLLQMDSHLFNVTVWLTSLPVSYFAHQLAPKSRRGTQIRAACLGFRDFLERTDGDRLRRLPPETLEKFLPWATAFGVEKHWSQAIHALLPATMSENSLPASQSSAGEFGTMAIPLDAFASAVNLVIVAARENAGK